MSPTVIYNTGCNEYERNIDIQLIIQDSNDSNHSSKFTVLVVAAKTASKANTQLSVDNLVFVCESYLFCDSCKYSFTESRNLQHHAYC